MDSGAVRAGGRRESCQLLERDGAGVAGEPTTTPAAGAAPMYCRTSHVRRHRRHVRHHRLRRYQLGTLTRSRLLVSVVFLFVRYRSSYVFVKDDMQ